MRGYREGDPGFCCAPSGLNLLSKRNGELRFTNRPYGLRRARMRSAAFVVSSPGAAGRISGRLAGDAAETGGEFGEAS